MMYICKDCKQVCDGDDICFTDSYLCTIDGISYSERVMCGCPHCDGELVEACQCEMCEEYYLSDEVYKTIYWGGNNPSGLKCTYVCDECMEQYATSKMALKIGECPSNISNIKLNGFLAKSFTPQQISEILTKELIKKGELDSKAKEYCLMDKSSFADWVVNEK